MRAHNSCLAPLLAAGLAFVLDASIARAGGGHGHHQRGGQDAAAVSTQAVVGEPVEEEKSREEMTPDDAGVDFETVVQSYIDRHSVGGVWAYKTGGKTWRLKLAKFNVQNLRKTGVNRFTGAVAMREGKNSRVLEFAVDFSGADWKVLSVKPIVGRGEKAAK